MSQRNFDYNRGFTAGEGERTTLQSKIDALQALLTAADERADEDDRVLRSSVPERHKGCTSPVGAVQSYIAELESRADVLEALLRDARQYHGVTLLTDPPQDAWKSHRISERIDALLKPEEPKEGPHLVLDIYGLGISAAEFMEALNITYQLAVPQSMTDTWWFFNCENVREISRLKVMTVTAQQCVGWGLSQHMADEIKARCKLPLKPVNLDVSFRPGTGGNHD